MINDYFQMNFGLAWKDAQSKDPRICLCLNSQLKNSQLETERNPPLPWEYVLRHDHVAEEKERMPPAHAFEHFLERDSNVLVVEIREPMKATEGEEVIVTFTLLTLQPARHEVIASPAILTTTPAVPFARGFIAHGVG